MIVPSFVERVVKSCLRISIDDKVTIFTWRHTLDLAEAFAAACERAGAQAHLEFTTDDLWYDTLLNRPIDFLETPDQFDLALAGIATAGIFIAGPENPERMKEVPAERWMAYGRADRPSYEKLRERRVRMAEITLGQVTPQRAKTYGFNYNAWRKNVVEAIDVEYDAMRKLGRKLAAILEKSKKALVTDSKGTNLSFTLEGRRAHIYDGIIDEEDVETGTTYTSLPGGSVSVAPTETSANGDLCSNVPYPQVGVLIQNMSLRFENGKLTSFNGGKNFRVLENMWEKGTGDKSRIGSLTLGLNPKASLGFTANQIVLGTVTIGIGLNKELGGRNESDWGLGVTLAEPTVKLDERTIVKQGKLTL